MHVRWARTSPRATAGIGGHAKRPFPNPSASDRHPPLSKMLAAEPNLSFKRSMRAQVYSIAVLASHEQDTLVLKTASCAAAETQVEQKSASWSGLLLCQQ